jgi:predicted Zn finger-like uncharacterized protein
VVVQCPTCQSKFRIADDKVTDRGVRVRCTSCKNVFQVRKAGAAATDPAPGPGTTMDLSSLDAAAVARPAARPAARSAGTTPAARPPTAAPPARPTPATSRPAAPRAGPNGAARRLEADDLFGMAELTGDAPLGERPHPASKPPPPPPAKAGAKPMPNFDDIDIEVEEKPSARPPPPPRTSRPPPPPEAVAATPPPPPEEDRGTPPPPPDESAGGESATVKLGAFKAGTSLRDPFEGMNLGEPGTGAVELATQARKEKAAEAARTEARPEAPLPAPVPEIPPGRELVSSALTGLVGAALAVAVIVAAALSDETAAGWLGVGAGTEIVATRVVSGLYDTASGKPVFFIRGRVENRSAKVRGPVRITAELVSEGASEARAEAIAGAEPSPEDVWSLRTQADIDKLSRTLEISPVERKLQPGASLPFFAVIADPPADLQRHRLHVKVEPVDAWVPPPVRTKGR